VPFTLSVTFSMTGCSALLGVSASAWKGTAVTAVDAAATIMTSRRDIPNWLGSCMAHSLAEAVMRDKEDAVSRRKRRA
jgi:hypothetical protein